MTAQKLDKVDSRIIEILSRNGRISWRDLAEQIGLSLTPPCGESGGWIPMVTSPATRPVR